MSGKIKIPMAELKGKALEIYEQFIIKVKIIGKNIL